jgi:hypothetical protein
VNIVHAPLLHVYDLNLHLWDVLVFYGRFRNAGAAQAATDCSSLRKAVSSYAQDTATSGLDTSITTFNALLDVLGFDEAVISQFGSGSLLVPTDKVFVNFVSQVGGPDVEPMAFVMSHPNTFKQVCTAEPLADVLVIGEKNEACSTSYPLLAGEVSVHRNVHCDKLKWKVQCVSECSYR